MVVSIDQPHLGKKQGGCDEHKGKSIVRKGKKWFLTHEQEKGKGVVTHPQDP